uniref:Uncharacterized protein n=1 Tax=Anguilla anguilla TaxID=7936 RepID=A0A0E9THI3_ANGAN
MPLTCVALGGCQLCVYCTHPN